VPGKETKAESRYQRILRELSHGRYVDVTKNTQFSEAWMILGVMLTGAGLAFGNQTLLAAALGLFVVAGVSWVWNELSLFGLHYERHFSEARAFLGETIDLTLEVRNQKFLPLTWLQITDVVPAGLPVDGQQITPSPLNNLAEFSSFWTVGAFQRITRRFTIHCARRGYHAYGPASIITGDAFGMFNRRATLPARQRLIVYPRLYSVAELRLPAKNPFGPLGAQDLLFEDPLRTGGIREWQPSDSFRRVHWKATARHQSLRAGAGQMLSRLYEPSREPQILVFLNVATLPRHWQGNIPELFERAISVAASLAVLSSEMRLPVGLIANGYLPGSDQPLRLLPGRSPEQLVRILELLAAVTPFASLPIESMLLREAPRLPWGATLLVVTAIAHEGLLVALAELARAGRQIVLFTLAESPPQEPLPGMLVYHLPHLVDDLIAPLMVQGAPSDAVQPAVPGSDADGTEEVPGAPSSRLAGIGEEDGRHVAR
jgi:uncharacterized protein (DUF58 family)